MHMSVDPTLSVVIVNWNTRELLARCLTALEVASTVREGLVVEILVVDNASTDGSATFVQEQFPRVTLLVNKENVGFARANNQAVCQTSGAYVLLLNSDTEVRPRVLETLVGFLAGRERAGAAGPLLLNTDGTLQESAGPMLTPWREFWRLSFLDRVVRKASYPMDQWDRGTPRRVQVLKGACLLLRRQALDEVGLLDDSYFMYSEEVDLCYRLAQQQWEMWWVPQAQVVHHGEASSRQMAGRMYIQLYRSKVQFYRKYGGARRAEHFKSLVRLAYLPRIIAAAALAPTSPAMRLRARTYWRLLAELPGM